MVRRSRRAAAGVEALGFLRHGSWSSSGGSAGKEPDGHPPFYALLGVAGWWLVRGWLDPLTSYRFGPMALTAATSGLIYLFLARRHGRLAGVTAALGLVLLPRSFAHAHYAHYDMPVTCLWLLAQIAFVKSLRSARWIVPFGVLLGLAAGTKFTGWFAVVPPMGWWAIFEGLPLFRRLFRHFSLHGRPRLTGRHRRCLRDCRRPWPWPWASRWPP